MSEPSASWPRPPAEPSPPGASSGPWVVAAGGAPEAAPPTSWPPPGPSTATVAGSTWPPPAPAAAAGPAPSSWSTAHDAPAAGSPVPPWSVPSAPRPATDPGPATRGRGRATGLVSLGMAAALALVGVGVGVDRAVLAPQPTSVAASATPTAVSASSLTADEPVAAAAAAVAPAVVQINRSNGLGSGVIYDSSGLILTAAHVVEGVTSVQVRLADGTTLPGRVLGTDTTSDVGVVKVDRTGLPTAKLAVGVPLRVGQLAVAIGSPYGLDQSVTAGVVSAIDRQIPGRTGATQGLIQTDAPINPGNSGGALADREGRVTGINDAIRSESGGNEGLGFAVNIDTAAAVAKRIVNGG